MCQADVTEDIVTEAGTCYSVTDGGRMMTADDVTGDDVITGDVIAGDDVTGDDVDLSSILISVDVVMDVKKQCVFTASDSLVYMT